VLFGSASAFLASFTLPARAELERSAYVAAGLILLENVMMAILVAQFYNPGGREKSSAFSAVQHYNVAL